MTDDYAPLRFARRETGQPLDDVFVGQAMKAIAPNAVFIELIGYREAIRNLRVTAMEGGIEARHLRKVGKSAAQSPDSREVRGLMQGCETCQSLEPNKNLVVDQHRVRKRKPTMHNAMPRSDQPGSGPVVPQPSCHFRHGGFVIGNSVRLEAPLDQQPPFGITRDKP